MRAASAALLCLLSISLAYSARASDYDDIIQNRAGIAAYAHQRGMTVEELATAAGTTPEKMERMVYALGKGGSPIAESIQSMIGFNEALKNPEKQSLLECMGIKVYNDPQPPGHPPSAQTCAELQKKYGTQ